MNGAFGILLILAAEAAGAGADEDARAGAWERSVERQTEGDLPGAEAIMLRAWGSTPDNYWAALRLAYLALLQGRAEEAVTRYQALRKWPEAAGDHDVVRGHASAIAAAGWDLAKRGKLAAAREKFRRALAVDPECASAAQGLALASPAPIASPELWTGYFGQALGTDRYRGFVLYGNLPVRIGDLFVVRATGRYLSASRAGGRSPYAFGNQGARPWTLDEEFLSLSRERPWAGGELVGLRSGTTGRPAIYGGAGRLRLGETWGGLLEASYLDARRSGSNLQAQPALFYWPLRQLGLQVGSRLTRDDRGNSVSATAGVSLLLAPVALYLHGHVGTERWAFSFTGPSLASFAAETSYGGSATLLWSVSPHWRLGLGGEGERLREAGASGYFWCVSGGLQYSFGVE